MIGLMLGIGHFPIDRGTISSHGGQRFLNDLLNQRLQSLNVQLQ
jgi:hypothetical protein